MPADTPICKGYDFNDGVDLDKMLEKMLTTGFQATNVGLVIDEIQKMRKWRLSDVKHEDLSPIYQNDERLQNLETCKSIRAKIFLAFTSNQISCGQREIIRFLVG